MATKFSEFPDAASLDYQVGLSGGANAKVRPPKKYVALLTQTGTDAPVATVLENTLGGTPAWSYVGEGIYGITLTNAFPQAKTVIIVPQVHNQDMSVLFEANWQSASLIHLWTQILSGTPLTIAPVDGELFNAPIIVHVYY